MSKGKEMKRLSFIVLLGLLLLVGCEDRNGAEQPKWNSVECDPSLAWLEKFLPMPESEGPKKLTPALPDLVEEYYHMYQNSIFLRVTVPTANSIKFMYHTMYPCSYSVKGTVKPRDNKIVLGVNSRKPAGLIPPCICNTTISGSAKLPHLDYDTVQLGETKYLVNLYEGLDTLIMFHTDVPDEPITNFSVGGLVTDQYGKAIKSAQIILQNTTQLLLDTVYTNANGYYHGFYELDSPINLGDTLSVIALEPFYNFYDTTKLAFADMDYYSSAWSVDYSAEVNIQLKKK